MPRRSVFDTAANSSMIDSAHPEKHYDRLVAAPAGDEPPCDCWGPPPPQFLLPPPPVDPAWAAADDNLCDIVAPYQVCRALPSTAGGANIDSSSVSVVAAILTGSGLLLGAILVGMVFFCKYRRRVRGLMSNKNSGKRADTSHMLYDGLPVQTRVIPNNMRSNGQVPHIEMVAVKDHQLVAGRPVPVGTLFVYPPPPSLTDDGSERTSNMYEEIPYYGGVAPSVSYCSDSDGDDVSRPSDDDLRWERRQHAYIPVTSDDRVGMCYLQTPPPGGPRPASQTRRGQRPPHSMDRRRKSPLTPTSAAARATKPARADESLHRNDPYYYSDILTKRSGQVTTPGSDVSDASGQYRQPCERRASSRGPIYCPPDTAAPPRHRADLGSGRGHVSPLANRIALDPFVDECAGDVSYRPPSRLSSFRSPDARAQREHGRPDCGYDEVAERGADNEPSRGQRGPLWKQ